MHCFTISCYYITLISQNCGTCVNKLILVTRYKGDQFDVGRCILQTTVVAYCKP